MSYDLGELDRRLANIIRFGTVADISAAKRAIKVKLDDNTTTDWVRWFAGRAGKKRKWSPPSIGEQVTLLSPSGEISQGVALPSIYQDDFDAPATGLDQDHTAYDDGTTIDYNTTTHALAVNCVGTVSVVCGGVTFEVPSGGVAINGGTVTHNGKNIGDTHLHSGVQPGAGNSGGPV